MQGTSRSTSEPPQILQGAYSVSILQICKLRFNEDKSGEGNSNPLQYSGLEDPTDRGAWQATVHGVPKSWTWLSACVCAHTRTHTHTHIHTHTHEDKLVGPTGPESWWGSQGLFSGLHDPISFHNPEKAFGSPQSQVRTEAGGGVGRVVGWGWGASMAAWMQGAGMI